MDNLQADTGRTLSEIGTEFLRTGSQITGWMKVLLLAGIMAGLTHGAPAAESPLSMTVRATEQSSHHSHILVQVENASDQRYERTKWRCVFLEQGKPVHEEENLVENVAPRARAVKRLIRNFPGPYDTVECRFVSSRPPAP
jgi:hypothetical protein